ncbi:MAG: hypothetical protein WB580_16600 [Candidatus Binataceae bacterium]
MVAGDELEFDPGRLAFAYRGRNFGTRRIAKAQQPLEDEVAFVLLERAAKSGADVCGIAGGGEAAGDREHAHTLVGEFRV